MDDRARRVREILEEAARPRPLHRIVVLPRSPCAAPEAPSGGRVRILLWTALLAAALSAAGDLGASSRFERAASDPVALAPPASRATIWKFAARPFGAPGDPAAVDRAMAAAAGAGGIPLEVPPVL